jgi:hypothetical protein
MALHGENWHITKYKTQMTIPSATSVSEQFSIYLKI